MKKEPKTLVRKGDLLSRQHTKDLVIRYVPVGQVILDPRNARTHSPGQIAAVAASIQEFGFTNPILIRPDQVVIAGHARLRAAQSLGLEHVPAIEISGLSEAQCRALAIADNQLALGAAWDEELLREELATLEAQNFDLSVLGFDHGELDRLLAEQQPGIGRIDPDAIPEPNVTPTTARGDVWQLGPHRLLCGDATRKEALDLVLQGRDADMALADPPYNVAYEGKTARKLKIENDAPRWERG